MQSLRFYASFLLTSAEDQDLFDLIDKIKGSKRFCIHPTISFTHKSEWNFVSYSANIFGHYQPCEAKVQNQAVHKFLEDHPGAKYKVLPEGIFLSFKKDERTSYYKLDHGNYVKIFCLSKKLSQEKSKMLVPYENKWIIKVGLELYLIKSEKKDEPIPLFKCWAINRFFRNPKSKEIYHLSSDGNLRSIELDDKRLKMIKKVDTYLSGSSSYDHGYTYPLDKALGGEEIAVHDKKGKIRFYDLVKFELQSILSVEHMNYGTLFMSFISTDIFLVNDSFRIHVYKRIKEEWVLIQQLPYDRLIDLEKEEQEERRIQHFYCTGINPSRKELLALAEFFPSSLPSDLKLDVMEFLCPFGPKS
jgi:hypothetical protein